MPQARLSSQQLAWDVLSDELRHHRHNVVTSVVLDKWMLAEAECSAVLWEVVGLGVEGQLKAAWGLNGLQVHNSRCSNRVSVFCE